MLDREDGACCSGARESATGNSPAYHGRSTSCPLFQASSRQSHASGLIPCLSIAEETEVQKYKELARDDRPFQWQSTALTCLTD